MLLAAQTAIEGWHVVFALLILLGAVVLEKLVPPIAWVAWLTLFCVALFGLTLTVKF